MNFKKAFAFVSSMFSRTARFFTNLGGIIKAVMEGVVLVVVAIMIDTYVLGSEAVINQSTTIGAAVYPILAAALLIAAIFGAIAIIYYAATNSFSN